MPSVINAITTVVDGDTQYGATVQYNCSIGYRPIGNSIITCPLNGSWPTPLTCTIVECGDPGIPVNGHTTGNNFTYGSTVTFTCDIGYELQGNKTALCQADGQWNATTPTCVIVTCGDPGAPVHGHSMGNVFSYGSSIIFSCDTGYELHGNKTALCQADGQWNSTIPTCVIVNCGDPGTINNGHKHGLNFAYGSHLTFSCNEGYVISSNITLECLSNGVWNYSLPMCTIVTCGDPGIPTNGFTNGNNFKFHDVLTFGCDSDFSLIGNSNITCQANGQWSGNIPLCLYIDCPDPGIPNNGQRNSSNFSYGASISFTCNAGYELSGNSVIVCEGKKKWSGPLPTCNITYCNDPGVPANGSASPSNFAYGTVVSFQCNVGFELLGSANITCQADNNWDNNLPMCTLVTCPNPISPLNGYIEGNSYTFASIITYHCNPSYYLEGNDTAQCKANKTWTINVPSCLKLCNDSGTPNNGRRVPSNPTLLTEGLELTFYCITGYTLQGASSITCLSSGQWSQSVPICVPDCSDPGTPDHGSRSPVNGPYINGITVSFMCNDGYKLNDVSSILCVSGQWSGNVPHCISKLTNVILFTR